MGTLQKNANRIKNIIDGKYTASSKVQSGYKKKKEDYSEGDVWEENNKTWTIKNGIKQTISKLDSVREFMAMPLVCPKCGVRMNKKLDRKFWRLKRQCFDCTIEEDTQRMIDGTFSEYEKKIITKNVCAWIHDMEQSITEYVVDSKVNRNITEDGQQEDWVGGQTPEELNDILTKQMDEFKVKAKDFIDNDEKLPENNV
jgi:site-specific DNA-cytosine methylase